MAEVIEKTEETTEEKEVTSEETTKEETTSKKASAEADDDDKDIDVKAAKNLYRALSDPKTAKPIIEALARQSGLIEEGATKKEQKEAKKSIQAVFKEALGDKLGFLADELGPAIEAVLAHHAKEQDEKLSTLAANEVKRETERAVEDLYKTHKDFEKFESRVLELMDEIAPGPNTKTSSYMEKLYRIAKSEHDETSNKDKLKKKLKDNSEDATTRLSSASDRDTPEKRPSKAMSIEDAMQAAIASLEKE